MGKFNRVDPAALFVQSFQGLRKFDRDLIQILSQLMTSLGNLFDRGLTISENLETQQIDFISNAAPDTEDEVPHTLGKIPSGYMVVRKTKAGDVYDSATTFTSTAIYIKCSVASVGIRLIVF